MRELQNRIENKSAVIGILGLGYVGLPLAVGFSQAGFKVLGFDVQKDKVSPDKAAEKLARNCLCGIFNPKRAAKILRLIVKK